MGADFCKGKRLSCLEIGCISRLHSAACSVSIVRRRSANPASALMQDEKLKAAPVGENRTASKRALLKATLRQAQGGRAGGKW